MGDGDTLSPEVQGRRLRVELHKAREEAGLTQEQVAEAMAWSTSKVIRIETGQNKISQNDLKALLVYLNITDPKQTKELIGLAKGARARTWWSRYRNIASPKFLEFVALEAAAAATRNFEPLIVPGLLQTEEYAREIIPQFKDNAPAEIVDQLVGLRMARQDLLDRPDAPQLFFVLDESVIRHVVGSKGLMSRQIRHLATVAERSNVVMQVLPFSAGIHPGMNGAFVVFEFPDANDADVLYLENPQEEFVNRNSPEQIKVWREDFERLQALALQPKESAAYLNQVADDMA
jgi:transcriptional regulator with XRE-family HTH domain